MEVDPAALSIVQYPHPVLKETAQPVAEIDETVRAVAARMIDLMHEAQGIGLAANQVGLPWRMFVADVPVMDEDETPTEPDLPTATAEPMVFINPTLSEPSRDLVPYDEGCLSLPGINGEVRRPSTITITATGLDGKEFSMRATDLLARCWQHEFDHLDGVLIIDRFTHRARLRNRAAIKSMEQGARTL